MTPLIRALVRKVEGSKKTVFDWGGEDSFELSPVVNEKSIV